MQTIGLDLDNTLIDYAELFEVSAHAMGYFEQRQGRQRLAVRQALRMQPGGEARWQAVQADVYGRRLKQAQPADGAVDFLRHCVERSVRVVLISHKTQHAAADRSLDLRQAALDWLAEWSLDRWFTEDNVYFCCTRQQKLRRIADQACDVFIDDLRELLNDGDFPPSTRGIWFCPGPERSQQAGGYASFSEIDRSLFG
ncbi:MAG: hypothetical protein H6707_01325 [Deltaproteobacteria bacterium]|nr:hypothetical protein [Deltaproteobacteria bacterium]